MRSDPYGISDRLDAEVYAVMRAFLEAQAPAMVSVPPVEVLYRQALLSRALNRHLDVAIRETQACCLAWLAQPLWRENDLCPRPYDATDQLPDHSAMPMDAFTAHVDAVLADCARWLAEVQEAQGEPT